MRQLSDPPVTLSPQREEWQVQNRYYMQTEPMADLVAIGTSAKPEQISTVPA